MKLGQKVVHKNISQGRNLIKDCDVLKNRKTSRQSVKEGTVPLPFRGKWAENRSHNLGKALGEGLAHKFSYRRKDGVFCEM